MAFSTLLEKMAKGQELTAMERQELVLSARSIEDSVSLAKTWVQAGTSQPIFKPGIEAIWSKVFVEDTASLDIEVPSSYNHLLLFGAGRNDDPGTLLDYLLCRFNGDTGLNYYNQKFFAIGSNPSSDSDQNQSKAIIGALTQSGYGSGNSCSFFTFIPHYTSNKFKHTLSYAQPFGGYMLLTTSEWSGEEPIRKLSIFSSDHGTPRNIVAGTLISVYGIP